MPPIPGTQVCAHLLHSIAAISLPHSIFEATTPITKGVPYAHMKWQKKFKKGPTKL